MGGSFPKVLEHKAHDGCTKNTKKIILRQNLHALRVFFVSFVLHCFQNDTAFMQKSYYCIFYHQNQKP